MPEENKLQLNRQRRDAEKEVCEAEKAGYVISEKVSALRSMTCRKRNIMPRMRES